MIACFIPPGYFQYRPQESLIQENGGSGFLARRDPSMKWIWWAMGWIMLIYCDTW